MLKDDSLLSNDSGDSVNTCDMLGCSEKGKIIKAYRVNSYSQPDSFIHIAEREAKTNLLIKRWIEAPENSECIKKLRNGYQITTQETQ